MCMIANILWLISKVKIKTFKSKLLRASMTSALFRSRRVLVKVSDEDVICQTVMKSESNKTGIPNDFVLLVSDRRPTIIRFACFHRDSFKKRSFPNSSLFICRHSFLMAIKYRVAHLKVAWFLDRLYR